MDVGRVFSISFAMFRQRFWLLLGIVLVFFAIQIAASTAIGIAVMVAGVAGMAGLGSGFEDPASLTGFGLGVMAMVVVLYGAYIVLLLAQQAAMVTVASPLEEPSFSAAMVRGFRSALPFFGIAVLLLLGYIGLTLLIALVTGLAGGGVLSGLMGLLLLPLLIYLACRFAVLIPVVAVDQVFNPVKAIRRAWSVTRGRVLSILLALIGFVVLTLVAFALPFGLIFAAIDFGGGGDPESSIVFVLLGALMFIPLLIGYTMFAAAFTAVLHSEVTGGGAERLEEVFA